MSGARARPSDEAPARRGRYDLRMHESKLGLSSHSSKRALVISLEPWGEDYTFAPGQRVTILARGRDAAPWFDVWIRDDGVTFVSIEGQVEDWAVMVEDMRVECGYGRISSLAAPETGVRTQR